MKATESWKSDVPYRSIKREALQSASGSKENIITPDKANAVFLAGRSFAMNENDAPSTALQIGNFILGGGTLSIAGQLVSNLHLERTFAYTAEREKRVLALTTADIKDAFKKYVDPEKLIVLRAGDLK